MLITGAIITLSAGNVKLNQAFNIKPEPASGNCVCLVTSADMVMICKFTIQSAMFHLFPINDKLKDG